MSRRQARIRVVGVVMMTMVVVVVHAFLSFSDVYTPRKVSTEHVFDWCMWVLDRWRMTPFL